MYIHICIYIYIYISIYISLSLSLYIYIYIYLSLSLYIYIYIYHLSLSLSIYLSIYLNLSIYLSIYLCVYTYIYIYTLSVYSARASTARGEPLGAPRQSSEGRAPKAEPRGLRADAPPVGGEDESIATTEAHSHVFCRSLLVPVSSARLRLRYRFMAPTRCLGNGCHVRFGHSPFCRF